MSLIAEEFGELFEAVYGTTARRIVDEANATAMDDDEHRDVVATADALADPVYVIYGMALEMGIDLPAVLAECNARTCPRWAPTTTRSCVPTGRCSRGPTISHRTSPPSRRRSMKS